MTKGHVVGFNVLILGFKMHRREPCNCCLNAKVVIPILLCAAANLAAQWVG